MSQASYQQIIQQLSEVRVLPILVSDEVDAAVRCARILADNGLPAIEITLRSANALTVLREVVKACPEMTVGAGTILTPKQLDEVRAAGATFGISPGITPTLAQAAADSAWPYFPGVATASDLMLALEHGFEVVKLFPADLVGSAKMAKALGGPFPQVKFCLTGGVTAETTPGLLAQSNILCVGGSWMCNAALMQNGDWDKIAALSQAAVAAAKAV